MTGYTLQVDELGKLIGDLEAAADRMSDANTKLATTSLFGLLGNGTLADAGGAFEEAWEFGIEKLGEASWLWQRNPKQAGPRSPSKRPSSRTASGWTSMEKKMPDLSNPALIEEMRWQLQKIEDRKADNARLMSKLAEADQELGSMNAKTTSPDRSVTVIAGPGGTITAVQLGPDAMRSDEVSLSRLITATIQEAMTASTDEQLSIVRKHVGREVDALDVLGPQARFTAQAAPRPATRRPDASSEEDTFRGIF
jgi:DNA-binding protein YbaB